MKTILQTVEHGFTKSIMARYNVAHSFVTGSILAALFVSGVATISVAQSPKSPSDGLGLTVHNGTLMFAGQPYRGIGANYFSLFSRLIKNPADTSSLKGLEDLAKAGIPFVRFECCGFWPTEQQLYLTNRESFFQRLDLVVKRAEQNHIGLIPSLFWHLPTVADLAGEPMDQLGNPDSKSIAFIRRYTEDVVTRYKDSPAIWGWEFANECNLGVDLPNASKHRPPAVPKLGTPKERTERDEPKFEQLRVAFLAFAETVRKHDRDRIIESGNSLPRPSAWHQKHERSWKVDTEEQFSEMLQRDNPDPMNVISVHVYREKKSQYPVGVPGIPETIALAAKLSASAGKPLFVGEFGVQKQGETEAQKAVFAEFLSAIESSKVPLAAFWVFDLPMQNKDWNVDFQNDRSWMIEMVARANAKLKKSN